MRLIIGMILGFGFGLFGGLGLVAGITEMLRRGVTEDALAMLVIGGSMLAVGLMTIWISVKAHQRRRALKTGRPVAPLAQGQIEGTLFGAGMTAFMNDIADGDGGDGGGGDGD